MFFPPTSFHTFFIMFFIIPPHPFVKAQPLFLQLFFIDQTIQKVLHKLGGVKCQPFLKISAYYVADLIHSLPFQFTNFVDKPKL